MRQRPSLAKVRFTTQRHGITSNFLLPFGRLTTSMTYQALGASRSFSEWLWYFRSAYSLARRGNASRVNLPSTCGAAVPSSAEAAVAVTTSSRPSVSTTICRFRPAMSLPPSKPCGPPTSVALTVWLSMLPAEGVGSHLARRRTWMRRALLSLAQVPSSRQRMKLL